MVHFTHERHNRSSVFEVFEVFEYVKTQGHILGPLHTTCLNREIMILEIIVSNSLNCSDNSITIW